MRKDLLAWGSWVLQVKASRVRSMLLILMTTWQTTGGAGFRFDAIKHMDRRFLLSFVRHVVYLELGEVSIRPTDQARTHDAWKG